MCCCPAVDRRLGDRVGVSVMPTEAEAIADHAVYQLGAAVSDLWDAYMTPEGKIAIAANIKRLGAQWLVLGDLLKLAANSKDEAA